MLAGVYLIGHNLDYLLFTTNGDIFWNETNELLEMANGALSFVTIGEEYVYSNISGLPLLS